MTTPLYTVAWPTRTAPDIDEIRFSYEFCRRKSRAACETAGIDFAWVDYADDADLHRVLRQVRGRRLLLVSSPELVLSSAAIRNLLFCPVGQFEAWGPVFNQTPFSPQLAALPFPYLDIDAFEEAAQALAQGPAHGVVPADELDPACILYELDFLKGFPPDIRVSGLPRSLIHRPGVRLAAATGALVHRGFLESLASPRDDLIRLVPEGVRRVLDIGCARGGYGKALKASRPDIFVIGIEQNPILSAEASPYYDDMIAAPVERLRLETPVDLVNCGDVLEHLQDPWALLTRLHGLLKPGGYLVMSVPNAGHWSIVRQLLRGRFEYIPLGPLCIGHLRWFTESSIREDLQQAGFYIDWLERQQIPPTPGGTAFIEALCRTVGADETSLRANEFILRAIRT